MEYPNIEKFLRRKLNEDDIKELDCFFMRYGKTDVFRYFMSLKLNEYSVKIKKYIEQHPERILRYELLLFDIFLEQDNNLREERLRKILDPAENNLMEDKDFCFFLLDWLISLHHNPSPWFKKREEILNDLLKYPDNR